MSEMRLRREDGCRPRVGSAGGAWSLSLGFLRLLGILSGVEYLGTVSPSWCHALLAEYKMPP